MNVVAGSMSIRGCIRNNIQDCCRMPHAQTGQWATPERNPHLWDHHTRSLDAVGMAQCSQMHACRDGVNRCLHASPNVTKNVLDWEYTREVLQSDLRARTGDQRQVLPHSPKLFHEGPIPQGPGASHVVRKTITSPLSAHKIARTSSLNG